MLVFDIHAFPLETTHTNNTILRHRLKNMDAADREFQFWERRPLSIELRNKKVFSQKLNYIHTNPVRAGLCSYPEDYLFSSAKFYYTGTDNWGFLTHYNDF